MIGIINAAMFGMESAPGEHVNWSEPDYFTVSDFEDLVGLTLEQFATLSPHMILFEVE